MAHESPCFSSPYNYYIVAKTASAAAKGIAIGMPASETMAAPVVALAAVPVVPVVLVVPIVPVVPVAEVAAATVTATFSSYWQCFATWQA